MIICMESTDQFVDHEGVRCRVWEGFSEGGVHVFAFIPAIAVHKDEDQAPFERDLDKIEVPERAPASGPAPDLKRRDAATTFGAMALLGAGLLKRVEEDDA